MWYECESRVGSVSYRTFMRVFDEIMAKVDPHTNSDLKHCQRCFVLAYACLYSARTLFHMIFRVVIPFTKCVP